MSADFHRQRTTMICCRTRPSLFSEGGWVTFEADASSWGAQDISLSLQDARKAAAVHLTVTGRACLSRSKSGKTVCQVFASRRHSEMMTYRM
jgi:cytolysin (calcineurin-like family phosphatase)